MPALVVAALLFPFAAASDLAGTLWWVSPAETQDVQAVWNAELDALEALGMDLIVLNGPYVDEAFLNAFLPLAAERGVRVFIDTLQAPEWWTLEDPGDEIARACARIDRLHAACGAHRSFAGWYIPYELYVFWDAQADLVARLYGEIAAHAKRAAPEKSVMISPFFILDRDGVLGSFRWAEPAEYQAFWTDLLRRAPDIDIVALQDSGEHLSFYTLDDRRPFFAAMKAACDAAGAELWANIETGELHVESFDDYIRRFGRGVHVNDPRTESHWRGVPAEKFAAKRAFAAEFAGTAVTWGYREFLRPGRGPEAAALHESYRAVLTPTPTSPE